MKPTQEQIDAALRYVDAEENMSDCVLLLSIDEYPTNATLKILAAAYRESIQQRDTLADALRFYAKARNYEGPNNNVEKIGDIDRGGGYRLDVTLDCGDIARKALATLKGEKP